MIHDSFRGLGNRATSIGMDRFHDKAKIPGEVTSWTNWRTLAERRVDQYRRGDISGPIIVSGNSLGAVAAARYCRHLRQHGIPVRALILYDYVWTFSNAIASMFGKGLTATAEHTFHYHTNDGRVIDLPGTDIRRKYNISHVALDDSPLVHTHTLEDLKKVL